MDLATDVAAMAVHQLHAEILRGEFVVGAAMCEDSMLVEDAGFAALHQAIPMIFGTGV